MNDDKEFEALLVSEIIAVRQDGERSFSGLLRTLAGPDPSALLAVLQHMATEHPWVNDLIKQALGTVKSHEENTSGEPLTPVEPGAAPHPLDFDWRFTPQSVASLEGTYRPLVPASGTVLFLGTPSLFQALLRRSVSPSVNGILIDKNVPPAREVNEKKNLKTFVLDVCRDPLPTDLLADVVLTDPPWYEQELRAFLWAAAALCRDGGVVVACLPGLTARPGVAAERARMLDWAQTALGLMSTSIHPKQVRYNTPLFERNTWRAAGIHGIDPDWRAGDVAILRKEPTAKPIPDRPQGPWEQEWRSLRFSDVLLRMRPDSQAGFADPSLVRLFPDDVLPSVSRRDARRSQIDVWSSGNHVFGCHSRGVLECIGRALSSNRLVVPAVEGHIGRELGPDEKNLVERAADQLLTLVKCESRAKPFLPGGE